MKLIIGYYMEQFNKYAIRAFVFTFVLFCGLFIQYVSDASAVVTGHNSITLKDTTVKIIWREEIYDRGIKANVSVLKLNESFFTGISDPEKAVIGYLASTIGNECYTDGGKQNVKCKILTALKMESQCSEANKIFLKNWFRDEPSIAAQIENCKPTITTTVEKTFDEVKISTTANSIKISLKGLKLNIKENTASKWSEEMSFSLDGDKLTLIERTKKEK